MTLGPTGISGHTGISGTESVTGGGNTFVGGQFANFVTDFGGVGDGVTANDLQWATALSSGDSIYVPPGVYLINGTPGYPIGGQTFLGIPGASIIQTHTPNTQINNENPPFLISDVSDILITGLTFRDQVTVAAGTVRETAIMVQGTGPGLTNRVRIENCNFLNIFAVAVGSWSNMVWIDKCYINGGAVLGSTLSGINGGIVVGGYQLPVSGAGLPGRNVGAAGSSTDNVIISNNYITGARQEAIDCNAISRNTWIVNNILVDNCLDNLGNEYIDWGGNGGEVTGFIVNNAIYNNAGAACNGILLKSGATPDSASTDIVVTGNYFYSPNTPVTHNNAMALTSLTGINNTNEDYFITNNRIEGWNTGIVVAKINRITISGNHIRGCKNGSITVQTFDATDIQITDNTIVGVDENTLFPGINLESAQNWVVKGNIVHGFNGTSQAGIFADANAPGGMITGNIVYDCYHGIRNFADSVTITGNTTRDNLGNGIYVGASQHVIVNGNQVYNNGQLANAPGIIVYPGARFLHLNSNQVYDNQAGQILTLDTIVGGSGYRTDKQTNWIPRITGGSGTGLSTQIYVDWAGADVAGTGSNVGGIHVGIPNSSFLYDGGQNYVVGDVITLTDGSMGPGSGFTAEVTTLFSEGSLVGQVSGLTTTAQGSGYTGFANTYMVAATGGTGHGAYFNLTITNDGTVRRVDIARPGTGYLVGDILSFSPTGDTGVGSGFSVRVATIGVGTQDGVLFNGDSSDYCISFNDNIIGPVRSGGSYQSGVTNYLNASSFGVVPNITSNLIGTTVYGQTPGSFRVDSAAAGDIGENLESFVARADALVLVSEASQNIIAWDATNLASQYLSAGDWDVWIDAFFVGDTTCAVDWLEACLSSTSGSIPSSDPRFLAIQSFNGETIFKTAGVGHSFTLGPVRIRIGGNVTAVAITAGGSGYTSATSFDPHANPLPSVRGNGAVIDFTVAGGAVTAGTVVWGGKNYAAADIPIAIAGDGTLATANLTIATPVTSWYYVANAKWAGAGAVSAYGVMRARRRR